MRFLQILLLIFGCLILSCTEAPFEPEDAAISGDWYGMSISGYPGSLDEAVVDTMKISFLFEEGRFFYSAIGGEVNDTGPQLPVPPRVYEGVYDVTGDKVLLTVEEHFFPTNSPMHLEGVFSLEASEWTIRLYQVFPSDEYPDEFHELKLGRLEPDPL